MWIKYNLKVEYVYIIFTAKNIVVLEATYKYVGCVACSSSYSSGAGENGNKRGRERDEVWTGAGW